MSLTFQEYDEAAGLTAVYPNVGDGNVVYPTLGLCGEAGELANKIKKLCREDSNPPTKEAIAQEIGDVLWYASALARELGYSLADIAAMNIKKLKDRAERGTLKGSGDAR